MRTSIPFNDELFLTPNHKTLTVILFLTLNLTLILNPRYFKYTTRGKWGVCVCLNLHMDGVVLYTQTLPYGVVLVDEAAVFRSA